jgi:hypothetical protein
MIKIALVVFLYSIFATLASRDDDAPRQSIGDSSGGSQANDERSPER